MAAEAAGDLDTYNAVASESNHVKLDPLGEMRADHLWHKYKAWHLNRQVQSVPALMLAANAIEEMPEPDWKEVTEQEEKEWLFLSADEPRLLQSDQEWHLYSDAMAADVIFDAGFLAARGLFKITRRQEGNEYIKGMAHAPLLVP